MPRRSKVPFPHKQQIVDFIRSSPTPVGKREIARAFQLSGDQRVALKAMLKEIQDDGTVERHRGRRLATPRTLPPVAVLVVTEIDRDGELLARPLKWDFDEPPPRIYMAPERRAHPALAVGERVLARLSRADETSFEARVIRKLEGTATGSVVGIYRRHAGGGLVEPADRRQRNAVLVTDADSQGADDGELVVADLTTAGRPFGQPRAAVRTRLGDPTRPGVISLIAVHAAGIPTTFPDAALRQAEAARPMIADGREDLRRLPLVTIDGPDARDYDDAVWAAPDEAPDNPGGWRIIVAIADVAAYVPPGSPLDREAFRRGNSCYFPDRVVPMLPEALSNGLCSLKPGEERACLAAHMRIDARGRLRRYAFTRALMRSAARLTYEQVQAACDGQPEDAVAPLLDGAIRPLYGAYEALLAARRERGTLDLDLPERQISLAADGKVTGITERRRLDSHRLIEEFMIAANVAAAVTLQEGRLPCLFRVHDEPDKAKVEALRDVLEPLGYRLAKGQVLRPRVFTEILRRAEGRPEVHLVSELILRTQAQAVYAPTNIGHFGLSLPRYAHFTSPIRRYADLTVHRALIRLLGAGADGAPDDELARLEEIGRHVSATERRADSAERDAVDRYVAAYLADRIGQTFAGRIGGVTRFGLFVTLDETGADGLVPIGTLPDDYYDHDERSHALVGRRWGRIYRLGAPLRVRLTEADPLSGSTVFAVLGDEGADLEAPGKLPGRRPHAGAGGGRRESRRRRQRR